MDDVGTLCTSKQCLIICVIESENSSWYDFLENFWEDG